MAARKPSTMYEVGVRRMSLTGACNGLVWTVCSDPPILEQEEDGMTTGAAATTTGFRRGFDTLEREVVLDDLPVTGMLPPWLVGTLVRTGPAKFEAGEQRMRHWFDGLAMLHRFSFGHGRASYASRFLDTPASRAAAEAGRIASQEFAADPCRGLFKRVQPAFAPGAASGASAVG